MPRRVVITGYGSVTPLGLNVDETWQGMLAGASGVSHITQFDCENFQVKVAAEVKNFDPTNFMDAATARHTDRFTQFALAASTQALESARFKIDDSNRYSIRILIGTGVGGLGSLEKQIDVLNNRGPAKVSPYIVPMMISDNAPGQISIRTGIMGSNMSIVSSCSTGTDAIGLAYNLIKYGECDTFLVGGTDAAVTRIGVAGFSQAGALSKNSDPMTASRPFDARRDGFIIGEGAAVIILEELQHALSRGASIRSEIAGYGATSDAFHITHPLESGDAGARAMLNAMENISMDDVGYINAHGTSTPINDLTETRVIKKVFGRRAYEIPVSSIKSMVGHMLGAAGALEVIICSKVVEEGKIPPTINYHNPDPDCDLDYVPNAAREKSVNIAVSNSFGFGGHNSIIAIKKYSN